MAMKPLYAGIAGAFALMLMTTGASAAVVCNEDGDCWKVKERLTYPPEARVEIYDDDFDITTKKYSWREAGPGNGYWRGGVWVDF
jgi:hypothetical protein